MRSTESEGSAKRGRATAASIAKQKSGMRLNDIPGARSLKIVVMMLIAASVDETPLNSSPSA